MMGISKKLWALVVVMAFVSVTFSAVSHTNDVKDVSTTTNEDLGTRDPGTQRVVLLERFTNTGCPPCVYATLNEEIFTDDYVPDRLAVLKYHVSWPSSTDPMYLFNPTEQMGRRNWYGDITGVPHIKIDGSSTLDYPYTYKSIHDGFDARTNNPSPVSIGVTGVLGVNNGYANITINAIDPPGSSLRLFVVMYENNIDYGSPPGSNGETHFEFTVRDMIPDENGEVIAMNQGDTIMRSKTFSIDPSLDRDQLGIVAIVQRSTSKEVLQSALYGYADISIDTADISLSVPSPVEGDVVTISAVVRNNGESVPNAVVRFYDGSVGGVQIGSDQTTGPISSGGAAVVQATWDTASLGGDHKVFVLVDADKGYWEDDEYNNVAYKDVFVVPINDASAIDIQSLNDGWTYPMGRYQADGVVKNTGFNPQSSFPTYMELRTIGSWVEQTIYSQDFDGFMDEGWGQIPTTGSWERGPPMGLNDPVPSSPNCWGTNLMDIAPALSHDFLISPPLSLPAGSPSITLKWWQYSDFEAYWGGSKYLYTDSGYVWVSTDAGTSWEMVQKFWGNETLVWVEHTVDLTAYAGQTVLYAFEMVSDSGEWDPSAAELGWYIDDVSVLAQVQEETVAVGPWQVDTSGTLTSMQMQTVGFLIKLVPGGQVKVVLRTGLAADTYPANDEFSITIDIDPNHYVWDLQQGWNLISLPLTPSSGDPAMALASINGKWDSLRYYDAADATDHWKELTLFKGYDDMPPLTEQMALWIHMTEAAVLNLSGTIPATTDVQLRKGWNFVGYPSLYDKDLPTALNNPFITKVQAFDPSAPPTYIQRLETADLMLTGYGYWLYATQGTTWSISN